MHVAEVNIESKFPEVLQVLVTDDEGRELIVSNVGHERNLPFSANGREPLWSEDRSQTPEEIPRGDAGIEAQRSDNTGTTHARPATSSSNERPGA